MKFGKKKAGAIAAGLSLVMALSPVAAFAAPVTAQVNKTVQINQGSTLENTAFGFNAEELVIPTGKGGNTATGATIRIADTETQDWKAGSATGTGAITVNATHAGVYAWYVTEKVPEGYKLNEDGTGIQYSTEGYTVIATVTNDNIDKNTQPAIYAYKQRLSEVPPETATAEQTKKVDSIDFTNKYTEPADNNDEQTNGTLEITKKLDGKQASKSQDFEFKVTFTVPDGFVPPAGKTVSQYLSGIGVTGDATEGKNVDGVVTFKLKGGKKATFTGIIAGTQYSVEETPVAGYTASYEATVNGTAHKKTTENNLIGESANTGVMTNTYSDITPTGLVINNAPFIVMIGAAAAGVAAYGTAKRKLEK